MGTTVTAAPRPWTTSVLANVGDIGRAYLLLGLLWAACASHVIIRGGNCSLQGSLALKSVTHPEAAI